MEDCSLPCVPQTLESLVSRLSHKKHKKLKSGKIRFELLVLFVAKTIEGDCATSEKSQFSDSFIKPTLLAELEHHRTTKVAVRQHW